MCMDTVCDGAQDIPRNPWKRVWVAGFQVLIAYSVPRGSLPLQKRLVLRVHDFGVWRVELLFKFFSPLASDASMSSLDRFADIMILLVGDDIDSCYETTHNLQVTALMTGRKYKGEIAVSKTTGSAL